MGIIAGIVLAILILSVRVAWSFIPRRPSEPGFKFVYVNQDGSAREVSPAERAFLSTEFAGGDSGRPYVKSSYKSRDGWGSLSGFIERRQVPARIRILPVHPDFDARVESRDFDVLESHRFAGDVIEKQADGSVACTPNPTISTRDRFELVRRWHLEDQRKREALAVAID